ncbi:MAG: hypothetical protein JSV35_06635 [Candidatus Bathyarchaeota archaeon]|nr:MAG: hypothetical protein JSV35_06635 [Candidatus Bathyarchaeota archaeon]
MIEKNSNDTSHFKAEWKRIFHFLLWFEGINQEKKLIKRQRIHEMSKRSAGRDLLKCKICNSSFKPEEKGFLVKGKNGSIVAVCPKCNGLIVLDGVKYDVDIMVVPVKEPSFKEALENRIYVCPSQYVRKNPKLVAFYLGGDVRAITHMAKVGRVQDNVSANSVMKNQNSEGNEEWKKYEFYKIFELEDIVELEIPIKREEFPPIQSRIYVDFQTFSKAERVEDFFR